MATIYAITTGEYSDYNIVHITTNKEIALAYAKVHHCRVEEFEDLNDISVIEEAKNYRKYVLVDISPNGDMDIERIKSRLKDEDMAYYLTDEQANNGEHNYFYGMYNDSYSCMIRADQPIEQIIKQAYDKRAKALALRFNL